MYESGVARPGAMAAILGDPAEPIEAICERASAESGLVVPANYNSPGQVVISGEIDAVERAMALAKEAGAKRAIRLNVSGAFHSPLMEPALGGLRDALAASHVADPVFPVVANVTAAPVSDAATATDLLARQLTAPVRWTDVVRTLADAHPAARVVEMGPGSVLVGLVRKIAPGVQTAACGSPADVDALLTRLAGAAAT